MKDIIYFLPGTLCDQRLWARLWPLLPDNYDYQHLEIPLHGHVQDIANALLAQLPDTKVNLVGFSLGGYLASLMAITAPERINKLFIIGNAPCPLPDKDKVARSKVIKLLTKFGYSGMPLKKVYDLIHTEQRNNAFAINTILAMDKDMGGDILVKQLTMTTEREDISAKLSAVNFLVHFCYGDQDKLVNRQLIQILAKQQANIRQNEIIGSGHMLPLEQPELLAKQLQQWLTS